jgi:hypothetical protein
VRGGKVPSNVGECRQRHHGVTKPVRREDDQSIGHDIS